jgi:diadenosine tetraphosphatase ApaH/serine/threonine PP2A family protein phosphatase
MTDREWLDSLPLTAEFLTPPGEAGGLFAPDNPGGLRCRLGDPAELDGDPRPGDGYVCVEFWAGGCAWVAVAELRTWGRYVPG